MGPSRGGEINYLARWRGQLWHSRRRQRRRRHRIRLRWAISKGPLIGSSRCRWCRFIPDAVTEGGEEGALFYADVFWVTHLHNGPDSSEWQKLPACQSG